MSLEDARIQYHKSYQRAKKEQEKSKLPDYYNKSNLDELDAINEFNVAKDLLFQEMCSFCNIEYLSIRDTKEYRRT